MRIKDTLFNKFIILGLVGYIDTPRGLRALSTVWA